MEVVQGYKYQFPGGISTKVPFTTTKPEEGEEAPATSETATTSDPTNNISPYGTNTNSRSFQDLQTLPKQKYTSEKLSVDTLVKLSKGNIDALLFGK